MQYEYYFENITVDDLQDLQSRVRNSNVNAIVSGASSGSEGITSVIFSELLTQQKLNRLITFVQNLIPAATFLKVVELPD